MRNTIMMLCVFFGLLVIVVSGDERSKSDIVRATNSTSSKVSGKDKTQPEQRKKVVKSDKDWRKQLSRKQFAVTRRGETEAARTGRYWRHKAKGTYLCVCCDLPLFASSTKFRSGTGWPSFYAPVEKKNISQKADRKLFYVRTEVLCSRCDAHLGHVFNDGPRPTGLRYCLNSAALKFQSENKKNEKASDKKLTREEVASSAKEE